MSSNLSNDNPSLLAQSIIEAWQSLPNIYQDEVVVNLLKLQLNREESKSSGAWENLMSFFTGLDFQTREELFEHIWEQFLFARESLYYERRQIAIIEYLWQNLSIDSRKDILKRFILEHL
ncbi:MAG: hypothetical protein ACRC2R_15635 [Xenococcaceae cyanobacterium]